MDIHNLKSLTLFVTRNCNSQCIHCQNGKPRDKNAMEIEDGKRYIDEFCEMQKLDSLLLFGGEPMLYPDHVTAFSRQASKHNTKNIQIITNYSERSSSLQIIRI